MPSAIQIISKLRLLKLRIPPTGMNTCEYEVSSGKKPGKPKSWAGNFAVVVPASKKCSGSNEGDVALRFFLAKTPSHITQITSFINNNPHPSLVGCKMYRNMLELKSGEKVDMMEMDFVNGSTIDDWIEDRMLAGDYASVQEMAEAIRTTINQLVSLGFYHGDLSHSNIMISKTGSSAIDKVKLIDYDSVLVKGIQNLPETKETGHPNFQHPSRKASRFTMLEDVYFTTLVIYVSLIAISQNPKLWQAGMEDRNFHSKGDNLIFQSQRDDLKQTNTELWKELDKINFPDDTGKAYACLKSAVNTSELVSSNFLSEIEEWFSTGTIPPQPVPPTPTPTPNPPSPNPPSPNPNPKPKPSPSPSPKSRVTNRPASPSPKPKPKRSAQKSPTPKKKEKKVKIEPDSTAESEEETVEIEIEDLNSKNKSQLKLILEKYGLSLTGTKKELIERIEEFREGGVEEKEDKDDEDLLTGSLEIDPSELHLDNHQVEFIPASLEGLYFAR